MKSTLKICSPPLAIAFLTISCGQKADWQAESGGEKADAVLSESSFDLPEQVSFNEHIRPIFNANCTSCHGGVQKAGGLSLIYRHLALGETKSGERAIVAGDQASSHILERIQSDDEDDLMPPPDHGPRLAEYDIALIKRWIDQGAEWEVHWAFEPPAVTSPEIAGEPPSSAIDTYIAAEWAKRGLEPTQPASPEELLRRMYFDVIGLPPTIEELDTFIKAYGKVGQKAVSDTLDTLLESPHYGERWASVWMDLARYADSEGLGVDRRWTVWPYRDWLIRAYDSDMPFDEFTRKQLAGDLVKEPELDDLLATTFHRLTPSNNEGGTDDEEFRVTAVMDRVSTTWEAWQGQTFSCVQCHSHPYDTFDHEEYYKFYAFFNHTADADKGNHHPTLAVPKNYKHYKSSTALLPKYREALGELLNLGGSLDEKATWTPLTGSQLTTKGTKASVVAEETGEEVQANGVLSQHTVYIVKWQPKERAIDALKLEVFPKNEDEARVFGENGFILGSVGLTRIKRTGEQEAIALTRILPDREPELGAWDDSLKPKNKSGWGAYAKLYGKRRAILLPMQGIQLEAGEELELVMSFPQVYISSFALVPSKLKVTYSHGKLWEGARKNYDNLIKDYHKTKQSLAKLGTQKVPVMRQLPEGVERPTSVFVRGNWRDHGKEITQPDVPASLPPLEAAGDVPTRLDMANWLVSGDNPLTSRVFVNRIWHQLFGRGIVETLEDFGSSGIAPTHPELLDYLAVQFQDTYGWSQKKLLREIILSEVYQLSATVSDEKRALDSSNQYYSYGSRRRLRGEAIRDMSLSVSGLLSAKKFGAPVFPPLPAGVWKPFDKKDKWSTPEPGREERYRRALYTYWKRSIPYPSLLAFDAPSREVCSKRRLVSNTPIAALTALNDPAFEEFTEVFAQRMLGHSDSEVRGKISYGYRLATSQTPSSKTLDDLVALYQTNLNPQLVGKQSENLAMILVASVILNLDLTLTK